MKIEHLAFATGIAIGALLLPGGLAASEAAERAPQVVSISDLGANPVSLWNEIAGNTISMPAAERGTAEERQPIFVIDIATVNLAIYDALMAIDGKFRPYAVSPTTKAPGASADAAVGAAAYGVLKGLFPARASAYQAAYDRQLAAIAEGEAKAGGIAIGREVAQGILALRSNDGRDVQLPDYVPGTAPGKFRGIHPISRSMVRIRPFALASAAQFRPSGPPALDSREYAADFNETKSFGGAENSSRSAAQTELARFHTEPPSTFWRRNLQPFASSQRQAADNARLMAMLTVAQADASIACFDAKYHFEFWRPVSAITLADSAPNPATAADPAWKPVVPTPNHPEYPAAHSCFTGTLSEVLKRVFHTSQIRFTVDSTVTRSSRSYASIDEFEQDVQRARIYGGMHFRTSTVHGAELGRNVARWVADNYFQARR